MANKLLQQCTRCKEIKEISEYHKDKRQDSGHNKYCKSCVKVFYQRKKKLTVYNIKVKNQILFIGFSSNISATASNLKLRSYNNKSKGYDHPLETYIRNNNWSRKDILNHVNIMSYHSSEQEKNFYKIKYILKYKPKLNERSNSKNSKLYSKTGNNTFQSSVRINVNNKSFIIFLGLFDTEYEAHVNTLEFKSWLYAKTYDEYAEILKKTAPEIKNMFYNKV